MCSLNITIPEKQQQQQQQQQKKKTQNIGNFVVVFF
jgi:hypothetical protein